jgi:hypothetical protein
LLQQLPCSAASLYLKLSAIQLQAIAYQG